MKPNKINFAVFAIVLIGCTSLFSGCNEPALESQWCDREIVADGKGFEWQDRDQYYDKDKRTRIGILNDENYLYVFLSTHDRMMKRHIKALGMTVWFDPKGGEKKRFGIRFPVGLPHYNRRTMLRKPSGDDLDQFRKMEMQILGPEEYEQKTMLAKDVGKYGICVSLGEEGGNLIYELKVPLTENERVRYAVRPHMAKCIGIGFETGKPGSEEMKARPRKRNGGPSDSKGRKPGGKGGGPPGGGRGGETSDNMHDKRGERMPEPFELWTRVQLSSNPDPVTSILNLGSPVSLWQTYFKMNY